jgi:hypothetical protein
MTTLGGVPLADYVSGFTEVETIKVRLRLRGSREG